MLHVRRIDRLEEFDCLQEEWNGLLDPTVASSVFSRHEWLRAWYEAFGSDRGLHVLVATAGGALQGAVAFQAFHERFAGLPVRRLQLLANGHSPCADLVAAPGATNAVLAACAHHLQEMDLDWDLAVLPEVGSTSALASLYEHFPEPARLLQPQRSAPYIRIGEDDWDGFRQRLTKNFQRALRNNRNRIARAGTTEIELLEQPQHIEAALEDMFAIGERSWQGEAGSAVGSTPANRIFYTSMIRALSKRGLVRLWFLRLAGKRIAFELHVAHAGVEFGLKTGYDREYENLGAGRFLDQMIVERLFAERCVREYDLLGDADPYKLRWTGFVRDYVRITLFGSRVPSRLLSIWNLKLKPVLRQARAAVRGETVGAGGPPGEVEDGSGAPTKAAT